MLIGSTAYVTFAWQRGEVKHESLGDDVRLTSEGFSSWRGIISPPDYPETTYREVLLPSGAWVKQGVYGRRSREGMMLELGSYRDGKRDGRWTYWNRDGSLEVERSGFYAADARIRSGPSSKTDLDWIRESLGS